MGVSSIAVVVLKTIVILTAVFKVCVALVIPFLETSIRQEETDEETIREYLDKGGYFAEVFLLLAMGLYLLFLFRPSRTVADFEVEGEAAIMAASILFILCGTIAWERYPF